MSYDRATYDELFRQYRCSKCGGEVRYLDERVIAVDDLEANMSTPVPEKVKELYKFWVVRNFECLNPKCGHRAAMTFGIGTPPDSLGPLSTKVYMDPS